MMKPERNDIHIVSRHSNWETQKVEKALKDTVYSSKSSWQRFLQVFLVTLGVGFLVSGVVFFFAYNWTALHRFAKLGIMQGLIVVACLAVVVPAIKPLYKNTLLTGTAVLVGVLFAVFGQIYQTGANAYDFFLAWTLFITIWVLVSGFPPLWLLYIILLNTTLILYVEQVAYRWPDLLLYTLLFVLNIFALIGCTLLAKNGRIVMPAWFSNVLALAVVVVATYGVCIGIFSSDLYFWVLLPLTGIAYGAGILVGFTERKLFYLAIVALSLIIMISALLIRAFETEMMLLLLSAFIIGSVTLVIKTLIDLQKKWQHEIEG